MKPLALQLYSLRELASQDYFGMLKKVADIGYKGVEPAGLYDHKPAEVKKVLDDLGLKIASSHSFPNRPDEFEPGVEQAKAMGYDLIVVPWAAAENFQTPEAVKKFAAEMEELAGRLKAHGLKLGYHNHSHEMVPMGGDYALGLLYDSAPSLCGQTDIYWATNFGAVDAPAFIRRHAKQITTLHIKDGPLVEGKPMMAVGSGKVATAACIKAADKDTLQWLIVELDECATDMLAAVKESYQFLARNLLGMGRK